MRPSVSPCVYETLQDYDIKCKPVCPWNQCKSKRVLIFSVNVVSRSQRAWPSSQQCGISLLSYLSIKLTQSRIVNNKIVEVYTVKDTALKLCSFFRLSNTTRRFVSFMWLGVVSQCSHCQIVKFSCLSQADYTVV